MKKLSLRELFQLAKGKEIKCCTDADQKAGKETKEKSDDSERGSKNNCCG